MIADVDPDGLETTTGQRWCSTHHLDAFKAAFGPDGGFAGSARNVSRLLAGPTSPTSKQGDPSNGH